MRQWGRLVVLPHTVCQVELCMYIVHDMCRWSGKFLCIYMYMYMYMYLYSYNV